MRTTLLMVALLGFGCGGEDESDFTCEQTDRSGTYLLEHTERSGGTCGDWPDEIGRLDGNSTDVGPNCQISVPDAWEDGDCKLTRSIECVNPDNGAEVSIVAVTTQQDGSAQQLTGLMQITIALGGDSCRSTYDVTATRQ